MRNILVLCEGNICRSPMAQGLLQSALPQAVVMSAGLGALVGHPADDTAVELMRRRSIDISQHRAVQVSQQMCGEADLILVMDTSQVSRLQDLYPHSRGRVYRVGEYTKDDIPDPYQQSQEAFDNALSLIDRGLAEWLQRIRKL